MFLRVIKVTTLVCVSSPGNPAVIFQPQCVCLSLFIPGFMNHCTLFPIEVYKYSHTLSLIHTRTHTQGYTHTHTHTHRQGYTHTHTHTHIQRHAPMQMCTHTHPHTHTHTHTHTHIKSFLSLYRWFCWTSHTGGLDQAPSLRETARMCVCVCVCVC